MPGVNRRRVAGCAVAAAVVVALPTVAAADPHTVAPGETLSGIAAAHGLEVGALAARNGITDPDRLVAGTTLQLDGGATPAPSPATTAYTVRAGDTLSALARATGESVAALATANGITDPHRLVAGQVLRLPAGAPGRRAAPPARSAEDVERVLESTARRYGWDPAFVKAIAWQESGWQMDVVSSADALGVMQVLPTTGVEMARAHGLGRTLDLSDLDDNVLAGVLLLETLHDLTAGDARMIAAGYFQGLGNIRRDGISERTARYVDNVMALRSRFAD